MARNFCQKSTRICFGRDGKNYADWFTFAWFQVSGQKQSWQPITYGTYYQQQVTAWHHCKKWNDSLWLLEMHRLSANNRCRTIILLIIGIGQLVRWYQPIVVYTFGKYEFIKTLPKVNKHDSGSCFRWKWMRFVTLLLGVFCLCFLHSGVLHRYQCYFNPLLC